MTSKIYAHRGGSGYYVENTLKAFDFAIELGCDGAELGVHLTKDNHVVVHHDNKLNHQYTRKSNGDWLKKDEELSINSLTLKELQSYTIGEPNPHTKYRKKLQKLLPTSHQTIPTLEEVIALVKAKSDSFRLLIEIKTDVFSNDNNLWIPLVDAVLKVVQKNKFESLVEYCSFDWRSLLYIKEKEQNAKTWFTTHPTEWLVDSGTKKLSFPCSPNHLQKLRTAFATGNADWYAGYHPQTIENFPQMIKKAGGDVWFCYWTDYIQVDDIDIAGWTNNLYNLKDYSDINALNFYAQCVDYPNYTFMEPTEELKAKLGAADVQRLKRDLTSASNIYKQTAQEYKEPLPLEYYWKHSIVERMLYNFDSAEKLLHRGLEFYPNAVVIIIELASLKNTEKKWDEAVPLWDKANRMAHNFLLKHCERYLLALDNTKNWFKYSQIINEAVLSYGQKEHVLKKKCAEILIESLTSNLQVTVENSVIVSIQKEKTCNLYNEIKNLKNIDVNHANTYMQNTVNMCFSIASDEFTAYVNKIPKKPLSLIEKYYLLLRWLLDARGLQNQQYALESLIVVCEDNTLATELYQKLNWITASSINSILSKLLVIFHVSSQSNKDAFIKIKPIIDKLQREKDVEGLRQIDALCRLKIKEKVSKLSQIFCDYQTLTTILHYNDVAIKKVIASLKVSDIRPDNLIQTEPQNNNFRILIVASSLFPHSNSTHFNLTNNLYKVIKDDNTDVFMMLSGEKSLYTPCGWLGAQSPSDEKLLDAKWTELTGSEDLFYNGTSQKLGRDIGNINKSVDVINNYNPDIIITIGDIYESNWVRRLLFTAYPICFVAYGSSNNPHESFDGTISKEGVFSSNMQRHHSETHCIKTVRPFFEPYLDNDDYEEEIKINDNQFIFMTPLQLYRIEMSFLRLSQSDIDSFVRLFDENPDMVWMLVGQSNFEKVLNFWPEIKKLYNNKRIIHINFTHSFRGLLRKVDAVFVMPMMSGGGQSVHAAMYEDLPVLVHEYSDSFGNVPKNSVYTDTDDAVNKLSRLHKDNDYRERSIQESKNMINELKIENVHEDWLEGLKEIAEFGKKRINKD